MCRGADCFRDTFLILATLAAVALGMALVLWHRTRPLYVKVIAWTKTERSKRGLKARPWSQVFMITAGGFVVLGPEVWYLWSQVRYAPGMLVF